MKKHWILTCLLLSTSALAGQISFEKGDIENIDKIDIEMKQQSGNCPTKFPVEYFECNYSHRKLTGVQATVLDKIKLPSESIFMLNVTLNPASQDKSYPFDATSCSNLQEKIKDNSTIIINKSGCMIK